MLNPFPELLYLSLLGPFIVRVAAGSILIVAGLQLVRHRYAIAERLRSLMPYGAVTPPWLFGLLYLSAGLSVLAGYLTQIGALIGAAVSFLSAVNRVQLGPLAPLSRGTYVLLCAICLSLLVTGAGAIAFDIPL